MKTNTKDKRIQIINYSMFVIFIILSFGSPTNCCLSFGHGLGDIVYLVPLWFFTILYFILLVFFKKKIKSNLYTPLLYFIILFFIIINMTINKGQECSCSFFLMMLSNTFDNKKLGYYID